MVLETLAAIATVADVALRGIGRTARWAAAGEYLSDGSAREAADESSSPAHDELRRVFAAASRTVTARTETRQLAPDEQETVTALLCSELLGSEAAANDLVSAALVERPNSEPQIRWWSTKWVVLLDGLDEVTDPAARRRLLDALQRWHPATRVVMTSRTTGYPGFPLGARQQAGEVELVPFGPTEVTGFVGQWFNISKEDASRLADALLSPSRPWLAGMVRIPLLLSLVCLLLSDRSGQSRGSGQHFRALPLPPASLELASVQARIGRLPRRRVDLYGQVLERLLTRAHGDRLSSIAAAQHRADRLRGYLVTIAWAFSTPSWTERLNARDITAALRRHGQLTDDEAADILSEVSVGAGVLVAAGAVAGYTRYRFLHRTFHEYLTAVYLANAKDWIEQVRERLWFDNDWREVLILLTGVIPERDQLLKELARQDPDPFEHGLALAVRAVAELPDENASTARDVISAAVEYLTTKGSDIFDALRLTAAGGEPHTNAALTHLLADTNYDTRRAAALALQGTTDSAAIAALTHLLTDSKQYTREAAAQALQGTNDQNAVAALTHLLTDEDWYTRQEAAKALQGTNNPDATAKLIHLLADTNYATRRAAALALQGTTDPAAIAALTRLLTDEDQYTRQAAVHALQGTTDPNAVTALTRLLTDEDGYTRHEAAKALQGTNDQNAVATLTRRLTNRFERYRRKDAALALQGTTEPSAIAKLTRLLTDEDLRWAAAHALQGTNDQRTISALTRLLTDSNQYTRQAAAQALHSTNDKNAVTALTRLLTDSNQYTRQAAAQALQGTNNPDATALTRLLTDSNQYTRQEAAKALQGTNNPDATAALTHLLTDTSRHVRQAAAQALQGTNNPDAITALTHLLTDTNHDVRQAAAQALSAVEQPVACRQIVNEVEALAVDARLAEHALHVVRSVADGARRADGVDAVRKQLARIVTELRRM